MGTKAAKVATVSPTAKREGAVSRMNLSQETCFEELNAPYIPEGGRGEKIT